MLTSPRTLLLIFAVIGALILSWPSERVAAVAAPSISVRRAWIPVDCASGELQLVECPMTEPGAYPDLEPAADGPESLALPGE